jgi:hypothetical protein
VEAVMAEVLGRPYHLRCVAMSDADLAAARAAVRRAAPPDATAPPDPASAPPRVRKALEIFNED